ncbi:hypothetical protein F2P81_012602 [Scophthalmus maximus]|uniref:Uncharacterized protein n=1 Tax=Scophthalmus maximus TaxID=52904 RepID=A0A6A4SUV9_SCOMX|nr:hypothetical protein F2P81_012602 [Scophthalmus maximus]
MKSSVSRCLLKEPCGHIGHLQFSVQGIKSVSSVNPAGRTETSDMYGPGQVQIRFNVKFEHIVFKELGDILHLSCAEEGTSQCAWRLQTRGPNVTATFEMLDPQHLRPLVRDHPDPLKFADITVDDALIYLLRRSYTRT